MKRNILKIFLIVLLGLSASSTAHAQWVKEMCPVMPSSHGKSNLAVDYQGATYYLCCGSCVKNFKRNPGKYLKKT